MPLTRIVSVKVVRPWPTARGCFAFAERIGVPLAPYQRSILRAVFDAPERELVVCIPRGNRKTRTMALAALYVLVELEHASVALGAASREMASIAYDIMRDYADHSAMRGQVIARTHELRAEDRGGVLRVLSGNGARAHGRTDDLFLLDELHVHRDDKLLEAAQTALVKVPHARLAVISTAAASLDSPLGRLRARALAGEVMRKGAHLTAVGPGGVRLLEWSVPDGRSLADMRAVKAANPNPDLTIAGLREQSHRVTPTAFAQLHCGRFGVGDGAWLPPGAWARRRASYVVEPGTEVIAAVDIGGSRHASAVVTVTRDLRVADVAIFTGPGNQLRIAPYLLELAARWDVVEVPYDPWRFQIEALRLEAEHGIRVVEFPQSQARLGIAAEKLHAAIVENRLQHPGDPTLDQHVARAVATPTPRGWRLTRAGLDDEIDGVIALAMAVDRASQPAAAPAALVGWI